MTHAGTFYGSIKINKLAKSQRHSLSLEGRVVRVKVKILESFMIPLPWPGRPPGQGNLDFGFRI